MRGRKAHKVATVLPAGLMRVGPFITGALHGCVFVISGS